MINDIFKTLFNLFFWLDNKLTLLKRTRKIRKAKKIIEAQGGQVK